MWKIWYFAEFAGPARSNPKFARPVEHSLLFGNEPSGLDAESQVAPELAASTMMAGLVKEDVKPKWI